MKNFLIKISFYLNLVGFDVVKFLRVCKGVGFYIKDKRALKRQMKGTNDFPFGKFYPILFDKFDESGIMSGHYFHTDLLIARKIFLNSPVKHIDIGSRTDGFVAHVASYREIEIFDIRPMRSVTKNIYFKQADLMNMPKHLLEYCDSISSLHALEHFGLGRYGDSVDINGHIKAFSNIHSILKPNGKFYFAVPIGKQRIEFNAHRIFSIRYLLKMFEGKFIVDDFSYVNDKGDLLESIPLDQEGINTNFNCMYGCGIFELTKIQ